MEQKRMDYPPFYASFPSLITLQIIFTKTKGVSQR